MTDNLDNTNLGQNPDVYLDSIQKMIVVLKENGYLFSNMKEYVLAKEK